MDVNEKDRSVLRRLGHRMAEVAALPVQQEKAELWRRLNGLEQIRPLVLLSNATWHETGDQITLECEGEFARNQEWQLRTRLYHWDHMRDDHVYEGVIYSPIVLHNTGMGIGVDATVPDHEFGARHYNCQLADDADPEMIQMPQITVDEAETDRIYNELCEVFDGVLPVRKQGRVGHWFAVMDQFIQWRGLDNMFTDMIDRPEWIHSWMRRMTDWHLSALEQYEKLGALSLNNRSNNVGPGGLGFTDELPQSDFDGEHVRAMDLWGHATTQIFSLVSPAMHDEFALTYEREYLSRFGLATYGCCEPLDKKTDIVKTIPNLRRVSMSPWVDPAVGAEGLGDRYVFSYKPNPAIIGMEKWDRELARQQLVEVLEQTRGCIVEVIMKDLHTCRREPYRMWEWVEMAMELAQEYAPS